MELQDLTYRVRITWPAQQWRLRANMRLVSPGVNPRNKGGINYRGVAESAIRITWTGAQCSTHATEYPRAR